MRILLYGKRGQIGWELQRTLNVLGEVLAADQQDVDFADLHRLQDFTLEIKPDLVVNAAAYTAVDMAESEPEIAMRINGEAPGVLADAAKKLGIGLVHYSTDYVFDGRKDTPYTEEDEPNPINIYGRTKLAGDRAIMEAGCDFLIIRTSWVYGARGRNFLLKILRLAQEQSEIHVVDDQIGSPTWCGAIAEATTQILANVGKKESTSKKIDLGGISGLYNYCSAGGTSWFEFAKAILERSEEQSSRKAVQITPIPSSSYASDAKRPVYTVLDTTVVERLLERRVASWREQLEDCWRTGGIENAGWMH